MTKKKDKNKKSAPILLASIFVFAFLWLLTGQLRFYGLTSGESRALDTGWEVRVNNDKYVNVDLDDFKFMDLKRLDIISISHELTEDMDSGVTCELLVYLCSVEAYLDGELIYSYGLDQVWDNEMIGSGYHFITLPENVAGKQLTIRMVMNEDDAFTSITPIRYTDSERAIIDFSKRNMVNLFIDIFLVMLGMCFVVIGLVAVFFSRDALRMLLIGMVSLAIGIWSMCLNGLFVIFDMNRTVITTMEYISLYIAPAFIGMIFWDMRRSDKSWRNLMVAMGTTVLVDFSVIACILHFTNSMRFPGILMFFHIIGMGGIAVLLIGGVLAVKDKNFSEKIAGIAFVIMFFAIAGDLARFNIQKYVLTGSRILQNSFIPLGTFLFVILLLASYFAHLYDMILTNAEKDALTKLAYHDALTGLYNRAMSYDAYASIEQHKEKVAIVSFDMNGLKIVNDTFGHDEGDKYLKRIAHLIERAFEDVGVSYRIGGDEFLVIVKPEKVSELDVRLNKFKENAQKATEYSKYPIEAAYGVAYFGESGEESVHSMVALADKRMYEMKAQSTCSRYAESLNQEKAEETSEQAENNKTEE